MNRVLSSVLLLGIPMLIIFPSLILFSDNSEAIIIVIIAGLVGGVLGSFTGIVPGIHANTLAIMMLSATVAIEGHLEPLIDEYIETRLLLVVLIAATSIAHTFSNFIPSTFLGAPEGETALSVLPMHEMVLRGKGYRAIVLSLYGSGIAVMLIIFILIFFQKAQAIGTFYDVMKEYMFWILFAVTILMISTERSELPYKPIRLGKKYVLVEGRYSKLVGKLAAIFIFLISGIFGWLLLNFVEGHTKSPLVHLGFNIPSTTLFPAFTGLFGLATLMFSRTNLPDIPEQNLDKVEMPRGTIASAVTGTFSGGLVGLLPGVTPGIGTIVAMNLRQLIPDLSWISDYKKKDNNMIVCGFIFLFLLIIDFFLSIPSPSVTILFDIFSFGIIDRYQPRDQPIIISKPIVSSILVIGIFINIFLLIKNQTRYEKKERKPLSEGNMFSEYFDREQVVVTLAAVNTAAAMIILAALFIILRPRNGTTIVINQLIDVSKYSWSLDCVSHPRNPDEYCSINFNLMELGFEGVPMVFVPPPLLFILIGCFFAAVCSIIISQETAKYFAVAFMKANYVKLIDRIMLMLVILVFLFTGFSGIFLLLVATAIGYLPPSLGLRRSHAMGVLLLPVMIFFAPEWLVSFWPF